MQESWQAGFQHLELLCFYFAVAAIAIWEDIAPRRGLSANLRRRWVGNICLLFACSAPQALLPAALGVFTAFEARRAGWGFFNLVEMPEWLALAASFLLIDLFFYIQHRIAHLVPLLWRFHRVHHSDVDFDFTTSVRFHPLDNAYQIAVGLLVIILIGAPPSAVVAYALIFAVVAKYQHGNVYLPEVAEKILRLFLVTSDMHRIHHSARMSETNSNYGGVLPWHDRLLNTYIDRPVGGHQDMVVGLEEFRESKHQTLGWMLINPFLSGEKVRDAVEAHSKTIESLKTTSGLPSQ